MREYSVGSVINGIADVFGGMSDPATDIIDRSSCTFDRTLMVRAAGEGQQAEQQQ
jgi:hypothetical protein